MDRGASAKPKTKTLAGGARQPWARGDRAEPADGRTCLQSRPLCSWSNLDDLSAITPVQRRRCDVLGAAGLGALALVGVALLLLLLLASFVLSHQRLHLTRSMAT